LKAVVVYESMFGNTRVIAESVAEGLRSNHDEVAVVPVGEADPRHLGEADLVVVGGPTHAWGMSRPATRRGAPDYVRRSKGVLTLEPGAAGPGVRELLASLGQVRTKAAAFDTRVNRSPLLTGRASKGIARELRRHGFQLVAPPESFFVTGKSVMVPGEADRARAFGARLAAVGLRSASTPPAPS